MHRTGIITRIKRGFSWRALLILLACILFLLSLEKETSLKLRSFFVSLIPKKTEINASDSQKEEIAALTTKTHLLKKALERISLEMQLKIPDHEAFAARIFFRDPSTWNSTCWIDAGTDNSPLIQVNSPVIVGDALIGIIDSVTPKKALVRLITDASLTPSVRVKRAVSQHASYYLAKGILRGSSEPLWRSRGRTLTGTAFNYDFADEKGPARDLRSGKPEGGHDEEIHILQEGDLLVTTGFDGLFPPDLLVATVTSIDKLREGDYFYTIEATPIAGPMENISLVFVLPPVN